MRYHHNNLKLIYLYTYLGLFNFTTDGLLFIIYFSKWGVYFLPFIVDIHSLYIMLNCVLCSDVINLRCYRGCDNRSYLVICYKYRRSRPLSRYFVNILTLIMGGRLNGQCYFSVKRYSHREKKFQCVG